MLIVSSVKRDKRQHLVIKMLLLRSFTLLLYTDTYVNFVQLFNTSSIIINLNTNLYVNFERNWWNCHNFQNMIKDICSITAVNVQIQFWIVIKCFNISECKPTVRDKSLLRWQTWSVISYWVHTPDRTSKVSNDPGWHLHYARGSRGQSWLVLVVLDHSFSPCWFCLVKHPLGTAGPKYSLGGWWLLGLLYWISLFLWHSGRQTDWKT